MVPEKKRNIADSPLPSNISVRLTIPIFFANWSKGNRPTLQIDLRSMAFPSLSPTLLFTNSSREKRPTLKIHLWPKAFARQSFSAFSLSIQAQRTDQHCRLTFGEEHFADFHSLICLCQFKQREETHTAVWAVANGICLTLILLFV